MQKDYETLHHKLEESYWFFVVRRGLIKRLLSRMSKTSRVLEIGCSSGVLLRELGAAGLSDVHGIDISEQAIKACQKSGIKNAVLGDGARLPYPDNSFDVLISSDVLEHIKDDKAALREWARVLKPGGRLVMLTPAFPFLWSEHDVANNHFRRYAKSGLKQMVSDSGFSITRISFWNISLFLPAVMVKLLLRVMPKTDKALPHSHLYGSSRAANPIFKKLLQVDNFLVGRGINLPFGVSLLVLASKNSE